MSRTWWQESVIYAILIPSFKDSNADGIGDLRGIISQLDYLAELHVDAIWLSPLCASPMFDVGYDVSDYRSVNPRFGTLDDYRALLQAAHRRRMKVIIDFVPNHTSSEHRWFIESRSSRAGPYRDFICGMMRELMAAHPTIGSTDLAKAAGHGTI